MTTPTQPHPATPASAEAAYWMATLDPAQRPQMLNESMHDVGIRKKQVGEQFVAEQLDFYGWRYTLVPLFDHPPSAERGGDEQASFERWARRQSWFLDYMAESKKDGHYTDPDMRVAWEAWQWRAALAAQPTPEPVALQGRDEAALVNRCAECCAEGLLGYPSKTGRCIDCAKPILPPVALPEVEPTTPVLEKEIAKWRAARFGYFEPNGSFVHIEKPTPADYWADLGARWVGGEHAAQLVRAALLEARASLPAGGVVERALLTRCALAFELVASDWRDIDPTLRIDIANALATPQPSETQGRRQMTLEQQADAFAEAPYFGFDVLAAFGAGIEAAERHHGIPASPQDGGEKA